MKNTKIVKRISALVIAGVLGFGVVSCAKKGEVREAEKSTTQQTIIDENGNEVLVQTNTQEETYVEPTKDLEKEDRSEETTQKVGKVELYSPVDFKTITDVEAKYNEIYAIRQEYFQTMKNVLSVRVLFSDEEVSAAVYNVIRADSDLASLMNKMCEQKRESVKNDYVDVQIEQLTKLKKDMQELQQTLKDAEEIWDDHTDDITETEIDKILKVKKFNNLALEQSIKKLEKDIKELEIELDAMNSKNI
ncbi:MAG: hypothetical protein IJ415_01040 [Clostridia bacterium]|nr:hypothetical protein [Clostridia bacterium]